jgi:hypothetical protein
MIERRFCHHDPVEYEYEYEYRCTEYEYDCPDERRRSAGRRRRRTNGNRIDRRPGCIALFGLPPTWWEANRVPFTRLSVGNNEVEIITKTSRQLTFDSKNFVVN